MKSLPRQAWLGKFPASSCTKLRRTFSARNINARNDKQTDTNPPIQVFEKNITKDALEGLIRNHWNLYKTNKVHCATKNTISPISKIITETARADTSKHFKTSRTYRSFLRWELLRNITNSTKLPALLALLKKSDDLLFDLYHTDDKPYLIDSLITNCLKYNDIANAVNLYIWYYTNIASTVPDLNIAASMINAIAFSSPYTDRVSLQSFLLIMNFLSQRKVNFRLTEQNATQICGKAMSQLNSTLNKDVLNIVLDVPFDEDNTVRNLQIRTSYSLIKEDFKRNNPAGVLYQWKSVQNHYKSMTNHDSRILYQVIKLFTKQRSYRIHCRQIIKKLEPEYYVNNALLLPSLINFATKTNNLPLASKIMSDITKYSNAKTQSCNLTSRLTLSTLLRLHLHFKDSSGVERILKQIRSTNSDISGSDYQAIVLHLLKTDTDEDLLKAVALAKSVKGKQCFPSIATIVNKLAGTYKQAKNPNSIRDRSIIQNLLNTADVIDPRHMDKLWDIVASVYTKTLTTYRKKTITQMLQKGNKVAHKTESSADLLKYLFIKSCNRPACESTADPFNTPNTNDINLKLTKNNKLVILRTIAKEARFVNKLHLLRWCVTEMIKAGMPLYEVELEWNVMEKHQMRRCSFTDRHSITHNLKEHGIKNFKSVIQTN
ncbi:LANO_0G03092g1_1 [Lachancea nothofagi CBS 11611]|uniref:LANO_0G03092g1_1 n=1 Tax=Lachancea nothofagi CBS 11611 TaxID=1266666 RepID=A0A1G4KFR6_9SACH|nr:LANO_0G03092g1_1 [Lachancea nothofagi CBS 11611]